MWHYHQQLINIIIPRIVTTCKLQHGHVYIRRDTLKEMNACFVCDSQCVQEGGPTGTVHNCGVIPASPQAADKPHTAVFIGVHWVNSKHRDATLGYVWAHTHPHKHIFRKTRRATEVTQCQLASGDRHPHIPAAHLTALKRLHQSHS